ncbi:MAG TPA: iron ABC transporter permease [Gammaproteobacteria bacterium]
MRPLPLLSLLALTTLAALLGALAFGSLNIDLSEVVRSLAGAGDPLTASVIHELRLPRALAAFAVGGLLALAGVQMQVLLGNPLADPYVLGVSGGAAVGALLAILLGLTPWLQNGAALLGAFASMVLVFGLARGSSVWSPARLLLTGVVLASGWGALISFLLAVAPEAQLRGMLFWLMGDLASADHPGLALLVLVAALLITLPLARSLNLLARGELQANVLGVDVGPLRLKLFLIASLLTATAVSVAGSVAFIGLVVPHLLRLLGARDHRLLLPAAVLCGGALLLVADTLARTLIAPQQLPVGVLTALLGVPLFLFLLQRSGRP